MWEKWQPTQLKVCLEYGKLRTRLGRESRRHGQEIVHIVEGLSRAVRVAVKCLFATSMVSQMDLYAQDDVKIQMHADISCILQQNNHVEL